jgi:hypothetical protein
MVLAKPFDPAVREPAWGTEVRLGPQGSQGSRSGPDVVWPLLGRVGAQRPSEMKGSLRSAFDQSSHSP